MLGYVIPRSSNFCMDTRGAEKRVVVMSVMHSEYEPETRRSIINAKRMLTGRCAFTFLSVHSSYIHAGRRQLLHEALKRHGDNPFDYFMMLDTDIEFMPEDIMWGIRDIDEGKADFVTGLYFNRHSYHHPIIAVGDVRLGFFWDFCFEIGKIYEITACGCGFMIMSRNFIQEYTKRYKSTDWFCSDQWCPTQVGHQHFKRWVTGEDIDFCFKARALGYKLVLDTNILLKHKGIGYNEYLKNLGNFVEYCPVIEEKIWLEKNT